MAFDAMFVITVAASLASLSAQSSATFSATVPRPQPSRRIIKALSHRWETVDVVKSRIALDEHFRTMIKGGKMDLSHYKQ